jgi:hypothetical protein
VGEWVLFRPFGEWQFYILDLMMYIGLRFFPGAPGFRFAQRRMRSRCAGCFFLDSALEFIPHCDAGRE